MASSSHLCLLPREKEAVGVGSTLARRISAHFTSGVIVRNWFEIQKRQQLCLTSVERQLCWVLGVTLSSDTVSWLKWPLVSRYFKKGFLKFWASELQGEKPLASSIDQSFGLQPCNESLEAWERGSWSTCGEPAPRQWPQPIVQFTELILQMRPRGDVGTPAFPCQPHALA